MRTNALILGFAALSAAASAAHAQSATPPAGTFGGWSNYVMGNKSCSNLTNMTVTVEITQDLVVSSTNLCTNGYSFQLNANVPTTETGPLQPQWQQYVIDVTPTDFLGHTQIFAVSSGSGENLNDLTIRATPLSTLTIPAGWKLSWQLNNDSAGNIGSAIYTVTDPKKVSHSQTVTIDTAHQGPIGALQMDIVGMNVSCNEVTFHQGAGTITYSSTTSSFSAQDDIPACNYHWVTTELGPTSVYGLLPSGSSSSFTQDFYVSPYQWHGFSFPIGTGGASPTILGDSSSPLTLSSTWPNAVTLAPGNFYTSGALADISWLGAAESASGNAQQNQCYFSGPKCVPTTGIYNWGIALGTDSSLFGWTLKGGVWLNNRKTGWGESFTSVAPVTASSVFLTNAADTSCASTNTSSGPCIYYSSGSTPTKWHDFGATQVAVDSMQTTTDLFAIDALTNIVYDITTGSSPTATALPAAICGGGVLVADQIAVKNDIVFAIQDHAGKGGWVYAYALASPACPDGSGTNGWTRVGTEGAVYSIATDQVTGMDLYGDQGCAVWSTDDTDDAECALVTSP